MGVSSHRPKNHSGSLFRQTVVIIILQAVFLKPQMFIAQMIGFIEILPVFVACADLCAGCDDAGAGSGPNLGSCSVRNSSGFFPSR
jgi:hypothetical protein